jgi:dihydrolipoamide dehydrogenase
MQTDIETRNVDVAVIGAGTAGLAAYRAAVAGGARALIVEGFAYGTTCARVGCMPSKLLIAAAESAYHARHAAPFGVHADVRIDGREVMARVRRERDRFVGFVLDGVEKIPDSDKIRGKARFTNHDTLEITKTDGAVTSRVKARAVVIATGSSPVVPPMFENVKDRLVINDDVFAWETLPRSVAVFGAGVIGLELGQALRRLGVRVRVFGRSGTVGPLTDPVVRASARAAFEEEFEIDTNAHVEHVRRVHATDAAAEGVEIAFHAPDGKMSTETFEFVLVATGRKPNLSGLGLDAAGLKLSAKGIPTHDRATSQCGNLPIFIAGDASEDVPILHEAADEGRIAGENAASFPRVIQGARRSLLSITFTEPQLAIAGATYASLAERDIVVGEINFTDQGRSRIMLQNRGIGHVYAERSTGRFLGAELAGPRIEHIGHLLAWAHQQKMTIGEMLAMPFYHPVIEEGLRTALRDAASKLNEPRGSLAT